MAEETTPTAPAEAPKAPESVADNSNTNTNAESAQAPDMHGFTSEQLADMRKFFDNNGGFDGVKAKISNPEPKVAEPAQAPVSQPAPQQVQPAQPAQPHTPQGAITQQEFMAQQYFKALAGEEKYAPIAKGIASGEYLKEMAAFGIKPTNEDGSINDQKVRMYLDLKAQTVPAAPTGTEPNMSAAPTVDYIAVGDKIENDQQAYQVLMQPNHPKREMAKEYIRSKLNPDLAKEQPKK